MFYSARCLTRVTCWTWVGFHASNPLDLFALCLTTLPWRNRQQLRTGTLAHIRPDTGAQAEEMQELKSVLPCPLRPGAQESDPSQDGKWKPQAGASR